MTFTCALCGHYHALEDQVLGLVPAMCGWCVDDVDCGLDDDTPTLDP